MAYVIGVAGPAGSGKSSLVRALLSGWADSTALYIDDYQRITREPVRKMTEWMNRGADFDEFSVPLAGEHLERLKRGEQVIDPISMRRIEPCKYILFETHFGRAHRDTGRHIDLLVWIDTPPEVALARNLRDFLAPMLPGGSLAPDRPRIAAIDSYLVNYLTDVRPLVALQADRVRKDADLIVTGGDTPERTAGQVRQQIVSRLP